MRGAGAGEEKQEGTIPTGTGQEFRAPTGGSRRRMSGGWRGVWGGNSFDGEGEGAANDLIPNGEAAGAGDFVFDAVEAVEKQLAEIGEDGGLAAGNTVRGEEGKEPAERVVDVGGGQKLAGDGGEFSGDTFSVEDEALATGMVEAEGGVAVPAGVATLAAVGVGVAAAMLADGQWLYLAGITGLAFHLRTSGSEFPAFGGQARLRPPRRMADCGGQGSVFAGPTAGSAFAKASADKCQQPEHNK